MKDKGWVVSTKNDLAQIEVACLTDSCQKCSAHNICAGNNQSKGLLTVKNPLNATSGDEVEIEIPDTKYNMALILLFGSLLVASLLGMGVGYVLSPLLPLSSQETSFFGLLLFLILAGIILWRHFHKKNNAPLYPVIIDIIKNEGSYNKRREIN
jgi:positive regulator of sigma E activity